MTPAAHLLAGATIQRMVKRWWGWIPLAWVSHGALDGLQFVGSSSPQVDFIIGSILWAANVIAVALMLKLSRSKEFWTAALIAWLGWDWEWVAERLFGYSPVIHSQLLQWAPSFTNPGSSIIEAGLLSMALLYLWRTKG
jgi:hypothetical protein